MRKSVVLAALREQRDQTLNALRALDAATWERPCLPGWRVRDVVAHLIATDEASVTGRIYLPLLRAQDRQAFEMWNEAAILRWNGLSAEALIAALERWGRRLGRVAALIPASISRIPVRGLFGRQPLLFLLERRVTDEWVHSEDIARVWLGGYRVRYSSRVREHSGAVTSDPSPAVQSVLAHQVLAALPFLVLPRVARTTGIARLVVDPFLPGGHAADAASPQVWGVDFARRQYGPRVMTQPDSVIRVPAVILALMAEGRLRWDELADDWLRIEGDKGLARDLLEAVPPAARA